MFETNFKVEQIIGSEYLEWYAKQNDDQFEKGFREDYVGNLVFIDAPTGSGKTTFILKILLPYLCALKKKVLYLVNRRILKKQIQEMISDLPHAQAVAIKVELYQEIEKKIMASDFSFEEKVVRAKYGYDYSKLDKLSAYDCVVCDECHYFLTDSNYNTNTVFSFRWIQNTFWSKQCIFMSATIRDVQSYIERKIPYQHSDEEEYIETPYYEIPKHRTIIKDLNQMLKVQSGHGNEVMNWGVRQYKTTSYHVDRDYSYIKDKNIRIIMSRQEIVDIVTEGGHKWLIFVDNINYGKVLKNSIERKLRELKRDTSSESIDKMVRMISSGYKRDQESNEEVDRIIRTSAPLAKVLIVTSVLDNGINIKDIDVRNLILFADTETEFIQMLGRKRKDAKQLKLYIYGYDNNHFCKRKQQLRKAKETADGYLGDIEERIKDLKKMGEGTSLSWRDEINKSQVFDCEKKCIEYHHKKMMQEILSNYIQYDDIKKVFSVYDGELHLNLLSFHNIESLICYYQKIIEKFEKEGEYAFAKEQLSWLGKTGEAAEGIIMESKLTRERESRNRVIAALEKIVGKNFSREENIKFTDGIHKDLRVLVAHPVDFPNEMERTNEQFAKWSTIKREFDKTGKPLSKQSMEFLRTYCRIPFQLDNDRKGGYMVRFVNQEGEDV